MIKRLGLGLLVLLGLCAAGCGGKVVVAGKIEDYIRAHARNGLQLKTLSCPSGVEAKVGNTLNCKIATADGIRGTLTVHITSVSGTNLGFHFTYDDFHPVRMPATGRVASWGAAAGGLSFTTVVPPGFMQPLFLPDPTDLDYVAVAPSVNGQAPNIAVQMPSNAPAVHDIGAFVRSDLRTSTAHNPGLRFSAVRVLKVDGVPARMVDAFKGNLHVRQVILANGGYVYLIEYTAPASAFAPQAGALDDVLRNWRWG